MNKIILSDTTEPQNNDIEVKKVAPQNLFQGKTEANTTAAKFPDWDIVPPNQFINPRVKK